MFDVRRLISPWFSVLEFALGVFVVLGHNIFRILPNEVPIMFALGWISLHGEMVGGNMQG